MRLLLVTERYRPHAGGGEFLLHAARREMERRGHTVRVLTGDMGFPSDEPSYCLGVERLLHQPVSGDEEAGHATPPLHWTDARRNHHKTRGLLEWMEPHVVAVWNPRPLTLDAARTSLEGGIPTAFILDDDRLASRWEHPREPGAVAAVRRLVGSIVAPPSSTRPLSWRHAACSSAYARRSLVEKGMPVSEARIIHPGIPVERYPFRSHFPRLARRLRILCVGEVERSRGLHTLLAAARRLASRRLERSLEITVVGRGSSEYRRELRRVASAASLSVTFATSLPTCAVPAFYREHDVLVVPSERPEPCEGAVLEAMASGLPVVGTLLGAYAEVLKDGENALACLPGRDDHLATRLDLLCNNAPLYSRLARAARTLVESRFAVERYVDDLETWLGAIATGRTTAGPLSLPA